MITGDILIGAQRVPGRERSFRAINPATGETLEPAFAFAGPEEVERACALAWEAFHTYRETGLDERARFLETIAANILGAGRRTRGARLRRDRTAARPHRGRARPYGRPAQAVCRGGAPGRMAGSAHRPRPAGAQAAAAPGPAPAQHRARARRGVRRQQLPARLLGRRRRHRLGARGGLSGRGEGASGAPGHGELVGRAIQAAVADMRPARGVFSLLSGEIETRFRAGRGPAHQGGRLHRLARRRRGARGDRGRAARADPGLRRDEQHQPGLSAARRAVGARGRDRARASSPR